MSIEPLISGFPKNNWKRERCDVELPFSSLSRIGRQVNPFCLRYVSKITYIYETKFDPQFRECKHL